MSVGKTIDGCTFERGQGVAVDCTTSPQGQPAAEPNSEPLAGPRLIGLCGYAGSGKDAAAACLTSLPDGHPDGPWRRLAFADAVRAGLLALDPVVAVKCEEVEGEMSLDFAPVLLSEYIEICGGWDEAKKSPEVRRLLQRYGTEAGRDIHGGDCWVDIVERQIRELMYVAGRVYTGGRVVITDVRFPNELIMIRGLGGRIVRITRPGVGPRNDHVSEKLVGEITPDAEIVNDGSLDGLRVAVRAVAGVREWEPPVIVTTREEVPADIKDAIAAYLRHANRYRWWQQWNLLAVVRQRIAAALEL